MRMVQMRAVFRNKKVFQLRNEQHLQGMCVINLNLDGRGSLREFVCDRTRTRTY
jgi:hypothetical protein